MTETETQPLLPSLQPADVAKGIAMQMFVEYMTAVLAGTLFAFGRSRARNHAHVPLCLRSEHQGT
jgi:hypothetical protein